MSYNMVSKPDHQQLWHVYDTEETDDVLLTKYNLCHDMFYGTTDKKTKKLMQLEWNVHTFYLMIHSFLENRKGLNLSDIESDIQKFKGLCDIETITYYKKRLESTKSAVNKSKYALGCWFLTNDIRFLNESIQRFIQFSTDVNKQTNERIHYLVTAFNLTKSYNLKEFSNEVSNLSIVLFYHFLKSEPRWIMEPIEIYVSLNKSGDYNLINNIISNIHRSAHQFLLNDNYHLHQSLLEISLLLISFMNLEQSSKEQLRKIIQVMIGESKEHDGNERWKRNEAMGAVWCFEQAKDNYEKGGIHEKVTAMLDNIRKATQDIQWKEFKVELTMPKLDLQGNNGVELTKSIVQHQEKIPNLDFIHEEAKRELQQHPLLSAVSHTAFNEKNPVSHAIDDDAILQEKIRQLSIWHIRLGENRLSLAVKTLEDETKITAMDMIQLFEQSPIVDSDQLLILKSGIENHFKGDHISSIHILTPQIEGMLRRLFEKKKITLLKTKRGNILDAELGSILNKSDTIQILGRNFANYLRIKYADSTAINQRNEVSHALASNSVFSYSNSLSLIHDLMILSVIS